MAPKKAAAEPTAASIALTASAQSQQDLIMQGIEEYELPRSVVTRICKNCVPDNVKWGKDAILGEIKGATVFINYLAATAQDVASSRGHKTVTAADVMKALEMIDHSDIAADLEDDLEIFRETGRKVKSKPEGGTTRRKPKESSAYKGKVKMAAGASAGSGPAVTVTGTAPRARPTKPLQVDSSTSSGDEEDYLQPRGGDEQNAGEGGEEDWQTDETGEFDQDAPDEDEPEEDVVEEDEDAAMDEDMMSPTKSISGP
ncbi:hypothetical protein FS837_003707 [Tulasnella sp. UAMH 9824]|nr:hypothetical protein FS837_003707 [Tulasnella sp. UAMH 9824]